MARLTPEEHAIAREVWEARPYERYEKDDPGPVQRAYGSLEQSGRKRR
jgi:hypothetical protein